MKVKKIEKYILLKVNESDLVDGVFRVPKNILTIDKDAFKDCKGLKRIVFPRYVGRNTLLVLENEELQRFDFDVICNEEASCRFAKDYNLEDASSVVFKKRGNFYTVNDVLVSIKEEAIVDGRFEIPEGIKKIAEDSVSHYNFKEVFIPEGVVEIEARAFNFCKSLEKVSLPSSLERIGKLAFGFCRNLSEVEFSKQPGSIEIESDAFFECSNLKGSHIESEYDVEI